ncbi:PEP-CTERM sorting domain-containing protein [Pseudocolwellia agarivorans]|uniref:PEP-CTERM sorting domain-containing protein n=1 Tax=Pseudocolwellia agarivorans TaxID=1911682 RepID=UPI000986D4CD|nr:PEP-CTERM sorting domain-containing protein [Pseudocolwellia agarivorans]
MKNNYIKATLLCSTLLFGSVAQAALVDLSTWESDGQGTWTVQAGNDSVIQTVNGIPGVFFENGNNARGTAISGEITVKTASDDDFIGFVLGYQNDELRSASADYWLIDWKQNDQTFPGLGSSLDGLSLSHVVDGTAESSFWAHTAGAVNEVARANNLGSTGWVDNTTYSFDIVHTPSLIQVKVDGVVELSVSNIDAGVAEFGDGAYGFYNYSQLNVEYAGITDRVIVQPPISSVPEPSTLAIFALGFAGLLTRKLTK